MILVDATPWMIQSLSEYWAQGTRTVTGCVLLNMGAVLCVPAIFISSGMHVLHLIAMPPLPGFMYSRADFPGGFGVITGS